MTRLQLILVGALSSFATILVLVGSVGKSGLSQAAEAALRGGGGASGTPIALVTTTPTASDAADSTTPASDDATGEDAESDDEVGTPTVDATAGEDLADDTAADDDAESDSDSDDAASDDDEAADDGLQATNIKHVFVITLQGRGFDAAFGSGSALPYLANELRPKGTLLAQFSSLGRSDIADRIAFVGGQPPNAVTRTGCSTYQEIPPLTSPDEAGVINADGCVYPNSVATIGERLNGQRLTWRAYAEDHEKGPGGTGALCRRPVINALDETQVPRPGDAYAAKNTPFTYFRSLTESGSCESGVSPLTKLDADLADPKATPNLTYIAPNLCHDGGDSTCDGQPSGAAGADEFLRTWVPKILASKAYTEAGLLAITFAGAPAGAADAPSRNGTLLLSRFAQAGGTDETPLDPYGLLRTVQDLFGMQPLAKAADAKSVSSTVLASARILKPGDD